MFLSVNDHDKPAIAALALQFVELGFKLVATHGTADVLEKAGFVVERVFKVKEGRPNVVDLIKGDRIQLIINTPRGQDTFFDEKAIRRAAVTQRIPTITTLEQPRRCRRDCCPAAAGDFSERAAESACREDHRRRLAKGVQASSMNACDSDVGLACNNAVRCLRVIRPAKRAQEA